MSGDESEYSSHVKRRLSDSSQQDDGDFMPPYTQSDSDGTSASTISGADPGGPRGPGPPPTTKNEAPAPKFYKTEAPEWQF